MTTVDNSFSIELQARLDEAKTKTNIDKSLENIKGLSINIERVTLQQSALADLKKVVQNNNVQLKINFDTDNIKQQAKNIGQNISGTINKDISSIITNSKNEIANIKKEISGVSNSLKNNKLKNLSKTFNLNRSVIDPSIRKDVIQLTKDVNNLITAMASKPITSDLWDEYVAKMRLIRDLIKEFGTVKADMTPYQHLIDSANYLKGKKIFISDMDKSSVFSGAGVENIKQLNNEMIKMGVTFSSAYNGASHLDSVWKEFITSTGNKGLSNITNSADQIVSVIELLRKTKDVLYGNKLYEPAFKSPEWDSIGGWTESVRANLIKLEELRNRQKTIEKEAAEVSSSVTNTIIGNEQRKQNEYAQTEKIYAKISQKDSLIKSGKASVLFSQNQNAAKEARLYFQKLLENENAVITTTEKLDSSNALTSFTVNVKRASGEIEVLKYAMNPLSKSFSFIGGTNGDSGVTKQIERIEKAFSDYTAKIEQFKSINSNILSGLSSPLSDFETKLAGLKKGLSTINDVKNSYSLLNSEMSKITSNFTGRLSKTDAAVRNIDKGEEVIKGLKAEIYGLNNAPKEILNALNNVSVLLKQIKQLETSEGHTSNWSAKYKEYENTLDSLKAKLSSLKKQEINSASGQVFNISDLDKQGKIYIQKISGTIEKAKAAVERRLSQTGYTDIKITGLEKAGGQIKSLSVTATDAAGALKKLNFERAKLQGNGKAKFGLVQTDTVKVFGNISNNVSDAQSKLEMLKAKWREQGIYTEDRKIVV